MNNALYAWLPLLTVLGLVVTLVALIRWSGVLRWAQTSPLRAKRLLTGNETEFLGRLRRALPGHEVLPQVAMGALLEVNLPETHPEYWRLRQAFAQKIVDYVVCRPKSLEVVAVVELDDRTHDSKRDKDSARDAMLAGVGIRTFRWDSRAKPTEREIALALSAIG